MLCHRRIENSAQIHTVISLRKPVKHLIRKNQGEGQGNCTIRYNGCGLYPSFQIKILSIQLYCGLRFQNLIHNPGHFIRYNILVHIDGSLIFLQFQARKACS